MTRHRRNRRTPNAAAEPPAHGMPWAAARADLSAVAVRATLFDGSLVYDRVDKPPVERRSGADAAA